MYNIIDIEITKCGQKELKMKRQRAYLEYMMKIKGVSKEDLSAEIGVSDKTIRNKLTGETDFFWSECEKIRRKYFPEQQYEKLFELIEIK